MEILMRMRFACIALVVSAGSSCFAQDTRSVESVKGEWVISNDITPAVAREKAIDQAKAEALRLAGVPEFVAESNLSYKTERNSSMQDIHKSLTAIDVLGEISAYKIMKEETRKNEFGNLLYEVWINATVMLHKSSKDPGFTLGVNGIRETYTSPEELVFDILPSKEGYLHVFILGDNESTHLYPNKIEKREKLEGGKSYRFPRSQALDYEVSAKSGMEINYVVLLYTKTDVPFQGEETPENILRFIARIDPSQKFLKSYSILIRNE